MQKFDSEPKLLNGGADKLDSNQIASSIRPRISSHIAFPGRLSCLVLRTTPDHDPYLGDVLQSCNCVRSQLQRLHVVGVILDCL